MSSARFYKFLFFVMLGVTIGLVTFFGMIFTQTLRENQAFRERESALRKDLDQARMDFAYREEYLNKLLSDPEFYEKVVREKLGYVESDEILFRFDHNDQQSQ